MGAHAKAPGRFTRLQRAIWRAVSLCARPALPGGESGLWRWLIPLLAVCAVALAGQRTVVLNAEAGRGLDDADTAQTLVVDAQSLKNLLLDQPPRRRAISAARTDVAVGVRALATRHPGDSALTSLDARLITLDGASRRDAEGLLAATRAISADYTAEAASRTNEARTALLVLLAAGLLLAPLVLFVFWTRRSAIEARRHDHRFRSLVQNSSDLIVVVDAERVITDVTPVAERMVGRAPEELVGTSLLDLVHADDVETVGASLADAGVAAWRIVHADGHWIDVESTATDLLADSAVRGIVLAVRDVSERRGLEQRLQHQAFHDALTGLPNRVLFEDRVRQAVARSRRSGKPMAVLFVDLDDFKTVNDSLGHAAGDELLVQTAARLDDSLRGSDTAARLGGDEFALLLEEISGPEEAEAVAVRLHDALEQPFQIGDEEVFVRASAGIVITDGATVGDDLLRNADTAMYAAKAGGKGRHEIFRATMHVDAKKRLELMGDLRRAVRDGEFVVDYQPLVALRDGRVLGAEALVRWNHPRYGRIPPGDFIPLAEETGLIVQIGEMVLWEACRQAIQWQSLADETPVYVSVNLSPRQFKPAGHLVETVKRATAETGLDPSRLLFEITETLIVQDHVSAARDLQELRALGARVAIDDFGTGYSTLSYLREFPIDIVKIDRSFVTELGRGGSDAALVRSVLDLGEALNMEIVAEGIEDTTQLDSLKAMRCGVGQGFYFSRPLTGDEMSEILGTRVTAPAPE